jgi:hypothetical protein
VASFLLVRREGYGYQARGSGSNQANYCRIPVENRCIDAHTVKSYSISTACFAAISVCHVDFVKWQRRVWLAWHVASRKSKARTRRRVLQYVLHPTAHKHFSCLPQLIHFHLHSVFLLSHYLPYLNPALLVIPAYTMAIAPGQLPAELLNLLALHSSFLTALSLHYAHNGTSTPADLRDLTASITLVWKQRQVTYDDIRLLMGVLSYGPDGSNIPYTLSDYGRGKIVLEIKNSSPMLDGMTGVNEQALTDMFKEGLDALWSQWCQSQKMAIRPIATPRKGRGRPRKADTKQALLENFLDDTSMSKFLAQLPLADIETCESLNAIAPLQEKGRKRLREFKESVQQGRSQKKRNVSGKENEPVASQTTQAQPAQPKITEFAAVRKTNLLDRILAKQEAAKCGPAAPTAAELQRRAALQRSEEVLGVLSLLCANRPGMRVSFSTTTVLQQLRGSIRSPISKEEALKCIEVIANEVAPGHVSIVNMGSISSVVVIPSMRPMDVKNRLIALGA